MTSPDFIDFFRRATGGCEPYTYQRLLAESNEPPAVLEVPTGSGKTKALLGAWLFQRQAGRAPRRLVYALPMRSLVEQTRDVAIKMREALELSAEDLPIHVLMGGEEPDGVDWRLRPETDQILIGTIDMLISRALNRGYAESRFAWPISFGLLNSDCRWVFDEVQLMGPARATSAQLDGLRKTLGTTLPCQTTWVSATVDHAALQTVDRAELGGVMPLPPEDRQGPLQARLDARKILERADLVTAKASALPRSLAELTLERHVAGSRTLMVLNTVERAQAVFAKLQGLAKGDGSPSLVLLHSRFRPPERRAHMAAALTEPAGPGTIVVATQVIEAGVDLSSRTLLTEPAPFSSIVQRLGRCNRAGEHDLASVLWLDTGPIGDDAQGRKAAAPYSPIDVERTRSALREHEGSSLSPAALEHIEVAESPDDPAILRRRDLLDLFDTSPDLSGMDIDIAPFIREDDDRNVAVFFRDLGKDPGTRIDRQTLPARNELVQVPRAGLRERGCWTVDHVEGAWLRSPADTIPSGMIVMLDALDGGYDAKTGWNPKTKTHVDPLPVMGQEMSEGFASDNRSEAKEAQELQAHLTQVTDKITMIADALGIGEWRSSLRAAAALHDVGKAHEVFQEALRKGIDAETHPDLDERLWAKSEKRGGRYRRPYFRHELASALAVLHLDGSIEVPQRFLTAYLVAAHHGKIRLSIRPAPGEQCPAGEGNKARSAEVGVHEPRFAMGVLDGDELPEMETPLGIIPASTLDLGPMALGAEDSWTDAAAGLRDAQELGPFRLAFLEALLRMADWRASG